jgi:anti-anti-sigma regulatory factor
MTFRIERQVDGHTTTLRLIGHLQGEHLEALKAQIEGNGPRTVLDLDQVTLVDVAVVRFLAGCEAAGIAVLHGPPYIREWIRREQARPG